MSGKKYDVNVARKIQFKLFEKFLRINGFYWKFIKGIEHYNKSRRTNISYKSFINWNVYYNKLPMDSYTNLCHHAVKYNLITYEEKFELEDKWYKFINRYKRIKKSNYNIYGK